LRENHQQRCRLIGDPSSDIVEFTRSLSVGRHLDNDLVLVHPRISSRHAVIEWAATGFHIRDLGSRNGTSVNGKRIRAWRALKEGDIVRFAGRSAWRVGRLVEPPPLLGAVAYLEIEDSGRRVPVDDDRFLIGTAEPADLLVEEWAAGGGSPLRLVLFVEAGRLWAQPAPDVGGLTFDGEPWSPVDVQALIGEHTIGLGATRLRVVPHVGDPGQEVTDFEVGQAKAYDVDLWLAFDTTASGTIRIVQGDKEWEVRTGLRFILLYVLARAAGSWVADDELRTQIWGRGRAREMGRNALNKLIHDTRQMFLGQGFDGWFIDKQRGATRMRLPADRVHIRSLPGSGE
jgi:hypothetical protein